MKRVNRTQYRVGALRRVVWVFRASQAHAQALLSDTYERWLEVVTWVCFLRKIRCDVSVVWSPEWDVSSYATLYVREPEEMTVRVIRIMRQYPMTVYQSHSGMGDWRYLPATHTINRIK